MELADGGELFDHCVNVNGNGPMPEKGLQLIARQILRGLAHAHLRGIVHLDLKMENILLKNPITRADWKTALDAPDAPIQLKIMDYGFCEFNIGGGDNVRWLGRTAPGTEGYRCAHDFARCVHVDAVCRAPEVILQLRELAGARITVASDLFSFGCVLCERLLCAFFHCVFLIFVLVPTFIYVPHPTVQLHFGMRTACVQMQR